MLCSRACLKESGFKALGGSNNRISQFYFKCFPSNSAFILCFVAASKDTHGQQFYISVISPDLF